MTPEQIVERVKDDAVCSMFDKLSGLGSMARDAGQWIQIRGYMERHEMEIA